MMPDIDAVTTIIREVAEVEVLPLFRTLAANQIREKKPGDLVTVADLATERVLGERLVGLVPGSCVVGEEAVHDDPALLGRLAGAAPVWIIDPIDGTTNFAEGNALFVVQIAYVAGGETRAAWIHDPVRARTAVAAVGAGAWMDGRRLRVAGPRPTEDMRGALYAGPSRPGLAPGFAAIRKRYGGGYRRCVGQEYLSLVTAELDFALFTRLLPWDHAAGAHIHAEAGGFGALADGTPYRPTLDRGYLLLAPDRPSWQGLRELLIAP